MRVSLKTAFWEETDVDAWRRRLDNWAMLFGVFAAINTSVNLFGARYLMALLNGLVLLMCLLIIMSKAKFNRRES